MAVKTLYNVPDEKNFDGFWVRSYMLESATGKTHCITRAGQVWSKINVRCKPNGEVQNRSPTYIGCTNDFEDFQKFTEWVRYEQNYLTKETNGKYWQLDKDILVKGNKSYSEDTCCFVPTWLNGSFTVNSSSSTLLGTCYSERDGKYQADCRVGSGKRLYLGRFSEEIEAHRAWQSKKYEILCQYAKMEIFPDKLRKAIQLRADMILDDFENLRITEVV